MAAPVPFLTTECTGNLIILCPGCDGAAFHKIKLAFYGIRDKNYKNVFVKKLRMTVLIAYNLFALHSNGMH